METIPARRLFFRTLFAGVLISGGCGRGRGQDVQNGAGTTGTTGPDPENPSHETGQATNPCEDFSKLRSDDLQVRKNLGYESESPIPDRQCSNCNLYLPPKDEEKCGGCTLFKGPVYSTAYCTYWAPQV
ncbi:MAG TPA: high-potential iron-sulfur protein [Anseongella sp.]